MILALFPIWCLVPEVSSSPPSSAILLKTTRAKQASLLEPSLDLARGGDLSRTATEAALAPGGHGRGAPALLHAPLTGLQLYRAVEARAVAAAVPFLPGALMSPVLVQLHSRMQFVVADKKPAAGGSGEPLSSQSCGFTFL